MDITSLTYYDLCGIVGITLTVWMLLLTYLFLSSSLMVTKPRHQTRASDGLKARRAHVAIPQHRRAALVWLS